MRGRASGARSARTGSSCPQGGAAGSRGQKRPAGGVRLSRASRCSPARPWGSPQAPAAPCGTAGRSWGGWRDRAGRGDRRARPLSCGGRAALLSGPGCALATPCTPPGPAARRSRSPASATACGGCPSPASAAAMRLSLRASCRAGCARTPRSWNPLMWTGWNQSEVSGAAGVPALLKPRSSLLADRTEWLFLAGDTSCLMVQGKSKLFS